MFVQLLFNGLIAGAIYALVSCGFSLIFSVSKFIHIAHGAILTLSAYALYYLYSVLGINFWLAAVATILLAAVFGWILNLLIYKQFRARQASNIIMLVVSFSLLVLIEAVIVMVFGADIKTIDFITISKGIEIFGAVITPLQIIIVATPIIVLFILYYFLNSTRLGKAMRAVSDNSNMAEVVGISSENIYRLTMIVGSAIAGLGSVLIALENNIDPSMGSHLIIKGFAGAVIGGIGNVPGAIIGSFILGIVENFGIWFIPSGYKDAIVFIVLFIFLLVRPKGIFNKN